MVTIIFLLGHLRSCGQVKLVSGDSYSIKCKHALHLPIINGFNSFSVCVCVCDAYGVRSSLVFMNVIGIC